MRKRTLQVSLKCESANLPYREGALARDGAGGPIYTVVKFLHRIEALQSYSHSGGVGAGYLLPLRYKHDRYIDKFQIQKTNSPV